MIKIVKAIVSRVKKGKKVNCFFVEYDLEAILKDACESKNLLDFLEKRETIDEGYISDFHSANQYDFHSPAASNSKR